MPEYVPLWPGGPVFAQAENQRLSTDCVLLADFVRIGGAKRGIDLGCASGAIALLLLERKKTLRMTGLELDAAAAQTARDNMAQNGLEDRCGIVTGDIRSCRTLFPAGSFDLAAANPPYFPVGSGALSPDPARAAARSELQCTLEEICRAAAWLLHDGGSFFVVHRPERLSELLCTMTACGLEPKRLRLVCAGPGREPSLLLAEGRRGSRPGLRIEATLYLTDAGGAETEEYRRIFHR